MKYYKLKVISKNKESLLFFYNFLFLKKENSLLNYYLLKKKFKSSNSSKFITILKAPHVYKTAQEQFAVLHYQEQYLIQTTNCRKFLKFIKKLKVERFSSVTILLKHYIIRNNYKLHKNITLANFSYAIFSKKNINFFLNLKEKVNGRYNLLKTSTYLVETDLLKIIN